MNNIYNLEDVSYTYLSKFPALNSVSLSIKKGERTAVLGANGSGKSTLLKILDALIFPSSGCINAFGRQLSEDLMNDGGGFAKYFRKKVGFVFQNPDVQLFSPTVFDEIIFGPLQLELAKTEIEKRTYDVMEMLGIEALKDREPYSLSGGEKKKVAIASVLAVNPEVLLLDEPMSGLDPRTQKWLVDILWELHQADKTIIFSTHDLSTVKLVADRAIILSEEHKVVADGDIHELLGDRKLLSEANLIHEHLHRHKELVHAHEHSHIHEHEHGHKTG